jgi:hypothetical protein
MLRNPEHRFHLPIASCFVTVCKLGAFPVRSRMNASEHFYCGATGYFGRCGMGL